MDFPGGPVIRTPHFTAGGMSLVRELKGKSCFTQLCNWEMAVS